jgi:hypothetical protein
MRWTKLDLICICFQRKLIVTLNLHCSFVAIESTAWIFFIFWLNKICVSPTSVVSSLSPPQCRLSSGWRRHAAVSCHAFFSWSQDNLTASASSSGNASSHRLPSWVEIEALNPHHCHRPPSLDRLTPTLYCYKKFISTLVTLPTTQLRLHFVSSLARAPHHRSSTSYRHSLTPLSHTHRPSAYWHPRWWTSWPFSLLE